MLTERDFVNGFSTVEPSSADLSSPADISNTNPALKAAATAREALLQRCAIEVDRDRGSVSLDLGELSPADFLKKVNAITMELYGRRTVSDLTLSRCESDPTYRSSTPARDLITIQGVAPESTHMSRTAQSTQGLNDVPTRTMLVGVAGFFLATGEDLLRGLHTRTAENVVRFHRDGIHVYHDFTDAPFHDVGGSKRLS